jgi:hypothetical protein
MSPTEGKLSYAHRQGSDGMYATELFDQKGETVAVAAWYPIPTWDGVATNRDANARRLAACWNLLIPFKTEEIEGGIDLVKLMQERDALKAEVERLRKDAERLDVLERGGIELRVRYEREEDDVFLAYKITGFPNDLEHTEVGRGVTAREAIDAAMK